MEIKRFFVSNEDIIGENIIISGEEFYHMTTVLRHKVGYKIIVCGGDGYDYNATIIQIDKDKAIANIDSKQVNNANANVDITLYQAVIKSTKLDFVIQKAVELGVKSIVLFYSQNTCETNINIDRLNKISKEASKQCKRADFVRLDNPITFEEMSDRIKSHENVIIPYEKEDRTNFKDIDFTRGDYGVIIGSEGGFTPKEVEKIVANGGKSVSLGNRILRAETAGIVAVALLMYELDEFGK